MKKVHNDTFIDNDANLLGKSFVSINSYIFSSTLYQAWINSMVDLSRLFSGMWFMQRFISSKMQVTEAYWRGSYE